MLSVLAVTALGITGLWAPSVSLSIDMSTILSYVFDYANMIIGSLGPVVAIGIGFAFGIALLAWLGTVLTNAIRSRM
jgi:hypothetical protein